MQTEIEASSPKLNIGDVKSLIVQPERAVGKRQTDTENENKIFAIRYLIVLIFRHSSKSISCLVF